MKLQVIAWLVHTHTITKQNYIVIYFILRDPGSLNYILWIIDIIWKFVILIYRYFYANQHFYVVLMLFYCDSLYKSYMINMIHKYMNLIRKIFCYVLSRFGILTYYFPLAFTASRILPGTPKNNNKSCSYIVYCVTVSVSHEYKILLSKILFEPFTRTMHAVKFNCWFDSLRLNQY